MSAQVEPYRFGEATARQLVATTQPSRGERTREWLELFVATEQAASVLAQTDFVPPTMKGKPAQVAATMMKGYELDIDPLDALANIYVIHGRIGFYAAFMRRRIIQAGHDIRFVETSDTRVIIEGRRHGTDDWQRVTFTAAQAKNAKIDLGGFAEDKLVARATSRLCTRMFPEVLSGAAIVEDLLDDPNTPANVRIVPGVPVEELTEAPPENTAQRKRQPRKQAPVKATQPPVEQKPVPDAPPLPGDDEPDEHAVAAYQAVHNEPHMCSREQQTKLSILLEQEPAIGKDRGKKLAYLETQFGRPFTSSKELSLDEASRLIDFLENGPPSDEEPDSNQLVIGDE